jgi:hypothetical protein
LKKMVGFGTINTNGVASIERLTQNVPLELPKVIEEDKHGVTFYVAVKNVGTGSDQFIVQGQQIEGQQFGNGQGFTVHYFLGSSSKPSESMDVTAAIEAGTFATSTMAAGAVTGDATMIRVVIYADKTILTKGDAAIFNLTFTSATDSTKQDTVSAAVVAK